MQTRIADGLQCKEQDGQGLSLASLIARLEKATGPDLELDVAIVYALHPEIGPYHPHCPGDEPIFWNDPYRKRPAPHFTESIDAAMMLVPPAADFDFGSAKLLHTYYAVLYTPEAEYKAKACPSLAIALCIAALKAVAETRRNAPDDTGLLSGVTSEQKDSTL